MMSEDDLFEIRNIIREEIRTFLREIYQRDESFSPPRIQKKFDEELSRFAYLNDQLHSSMKAGTLMKGCKYETKKMDQILVDVKNIDSKI